MSSGSPRRAEGIFDKIASLNLGCSPCYDTEVIKNCKKNICMHSLGSDLVFDMIEDFNL